MPKIAVAILLAASIRIFAADPFFLRRSLADVSPKPDDLTFNARGAYYKPVFGIGDKDAGKLQSVSRYGELAVDPGGFTAVVSYPAEEQIYYVLEGRGTLVYEGRIVPVERDDFIYMPIDVKHGIANSSDADIRVLVMGYKIPPGRQVLPTPSLLMANAKDVPLQTLPTHGPTTKFKLLMGHHYPERDKVTASSEVTSFFLMDFAPGGTNIPHTHPSEEEIYFLMRGHGEVVAGRTADGQDARYASQPGDIFFFAPNTRVGYYSRPQEGEAHEVILAVRSRLPKPTSGAVGR